METWFTSDLHFGHVNILKYMRQQRPFSSLEEMADEIIERHNELVAENDTVYILGDLSMGKVVDNVPIVQRMNGKKTLIPGNHDRCWDYFYPMAKEEKAKEFKKFYADQGLTIMQGPIDDWWDLGHGEMVPVVLSHFPWDVYNNDGREKAHHPIRSQYSKDAWIVHGHVHGDWMCVPTARMYNVGIDVHGLEPTNKSHIIDRIKRTRALL